MNLLREYDTYYVNFNSTWFSACLDNVLINFRNENFDCTAIDPYLMDHSEVCFEMERNITERGNHPEIFKTVNHVNINKYIILLAEVDWSSIIISSSRILNFNLMFY